MSIQIIVRDDVGTETDVTEAVQVMYDMVHASMDWGSGFFDADEVAAVVALADAAGFAPLDLALGNYNEANLYSKERREANPELKDIANRAKDARALFQSIPKIRP